ncbi:MAG: ral nucleoside transport system permease protein [Frankiales bacterium]|nr:ral nucleoside transport system permease protein [Frankiales bacterium]
MSTTLEAPIAEPLRRQGIRGVGGAQWLLISAVILVLLSFVRATTGATDLTSDGTIGAALTLAVPIGLAGLGGLFAERVGVVNIGLEGMMILGTWFGAYGGWQWGPWRGVAFGILGGALGGLLHAIVTVTFGVDHIISGVSINLLGAGLARYLSGVIFTGHSGGGATQSPPGKGAISTFDVPVLSGGWGSPDVLGSLEKHHWFLISDLAGILRGLTVGVSWLTLLAVLLVPATYLFFWRTKLGLRMRSVGESPLAAESLGVPVYRMKYIGVVVSGALAGLAGSFLVIVGANYYREGQTGGRGFIGLAAMIFGNWRPGGLAAGASLFGYADGLQLRQKSAVHGLLLFVALLLVLIAVRAVLRRQFVQALVAAAVAVAFALWFSLSTVVPSGIVSFTPHITTLLVLALASQRLRPPAADGVPYRKGEAG